MPGGAELPRPSRRRTQRGTSRTGRARRWRASSPRPPPRRCAGAPRNPAARRRHGGRGADLPLAVSLPSESAPASRPRPRARGGRGGRAGGLAVGDPSARPRRTRRRQRRQPTATAEAGRASGQNAHGATSSRWEKNLHLPPYFAPFRLCSLCPDPKAPLPVTRLPIGMPTIVGIDFGLIPRPRAPPTYRGSGDSPILRRHGRHLRPGPPSSRYSPASSRPPARGGEGQRPQDRPGHLREQPSVVHRLDRDPGGSPRPVHFLAKASYFKGRSVPLSSSPPSAPSSSSAAQARRRSTRSTSSGTLLEEGNAVALYPEGTRSLDGRLYKGRTGVAFLALQTGAPVVPVGLIGTDDGMPVGAKMPIAPPPRHRQVRRAPRPRRTTARHHRAGARRLATDEIMAAIHALLGPGSSRTPTTRCPRRDPIDRIKQVLPAPRRPRRVAPSGRRDDDRRLVPHWEVHRVRDEAPARAPARGRRSRHPTIDGIRHGHARPQHDLAEGTAAAPVLDHQTGCRRPRSPTTTTPACTQACRYDSRWHSLKGGEEHVLGVPPRRIAPERLVGRTPAARACRRSRSSRPGRSPGSRRCRCRRSPVHVVRTGVSMLTQHAAQSCHAGLPRADHGGRLAGCRRPSPLADAVELAVVERGRIRRVAPRRASPSCWPPTARSREARRPVGADPPRSSLKPLQALASPRRRGPARRASGSGWRPRAIPAPTATSPSSATSSHAARARRGGPRVPGRVAGRHRRPATSWCASSAQPGAHPHELLGQARGDAADHASSNGWDIDGYLDAGASAAGPHPRRRSSA